MISNDTGERRPAPIVIVLATAAGCTEEIHVRPFETDDVSGEHVPAETDREP